MMDDQIKKQVKVTERKRMNTDSVNSLTNFENSSDVNVVSGYTHLTLEEGLRGGDRTGQDRTISQQSGTEMSLDCSVYPHCLSLQLK